MSKIFKDALLPSKVNISELILFIRNEKVILDFDLAFLYQTENRSIKQAVKRNIKRFPDDFLFQLTKKEWMELITNCDRFRRFRNSHVPPLALTE